MYSIIDIETTGGNSKTGKITEIAIYVHNGKEIVREFCSLINPGIPIPPFITNLTGISQEMVNAAPSFCDVAEEINRITANTVFVAHNANFDYSFIREEYRKLGLEFKRRRLCTVQLSRKSFPGLESYSLGKITTQLNIQLTNHHRASTDALATVRLFEKIITQEQITGLFDSHYGIPDLTGISSPYISEEIINSIPDETGIIRFYNRRDEAIYVKRSAHMRETVIAKFKKEESKNNEEFRSEVYRIETTVTGSPLLAQLFETADVLSAKPRYNFGRTSLKVHYALDLCESSHGWKLHINRAAKCADPVMKFGSFKEAFAVLKKISDGLKIPLQQNFRSKRPEASINISEATQLESVDNYLNFANRSLMIVDEGRKADERLVLIVADGALQGYCYWPHDQAITHVSDLENSLTTIENSLDALMIISKFIEKGNVERIIEVSRS